MRSFSLNKFSRREIVLGAAGSALQVSANAQAPAVTDLARTAREANQRNSEALSKMDLPIATEPAFQFKA
jgi:hypothetical protein